MTSVSFILCFLYIRKWLWPGVFVPHWALALVGLGLVGSGSHIAWMDAMWFYKFNSISVIPHQWKSGNAIERLVTSEGLNLNCLLTGQLLSLGASGASCFQKKHIPMQ